MIERCLKLLPIDYAGELDEEQFQTILSHAKKMVFEAKQVIINKGNMLFISLIRAAELRLHCTGSTLPPEWTLKIYLVI